jgi:hypothetical protein
MNLMMSLLMMWTMGLGGMPGGSAVGTAPADMPQRAAAVATRLDTGGDLYVIRNTEGQLESSLRGMGGLLPMLGGGRDPAAGQASVDVLTAFFRENGFLAGQCVGASTVPRADGLRDMKIFLMRQPAAAELPLWRGLVGAAPAKPDLLACLPGDTVLVLHARGEPAKLWQLVRSGLLRFRCDGDEQQLQALLEGTGQQAGVDLDTLAASLGNEWVLSLQLGAPAADGSSPFPVPAFLVVARASDATAVTLAQHLLGKSGAALAPQALEGALVYAQPAVGRGPVPLQMAVAFQDGLVLFASSPERIAQALVCRRDGGGLAARPAFQELFATLPAESNLLFYADARLAITLNALRSMQAANNAGGGRGPVPRELSFFLGGPLPEAASGWVAVNGPDGVHIQGRGSGQLARQFAGIGGQNPFLLAAVALPGLQRARGTAAGNACINNLRMIDGAKEQWAIEHNRAEGDDPPAEDLSPYIKGGFERLRCPQGGTYSINPIGRKPTCTHAGHALP